MKGQSRHNYEIDPEDGREHLDGPECWCDPCPYCVDEKGRGVWIHRSSPESEYLPPADVLAEAIALFINDGGWSNDE